MPQRFYGKPQSLDQQPDKTFNFTTKLLTPKVFFLLHGLYVSVTLLLFGTMYSYKSCQGGNYYCIVLCSYMQRNMSIYYRTQSAI